MTLNLSPTERDLTKIVAAILQLAQGRSNAVGSVTLDPGSTTTVVTKDTAGSRAAVNVAMGAKVFLEAETLDAAALSLTKRVSAVGQGTFTITHAAAGANARFSWVALGGS